MPLAGRAACTLETVHKSAREELAALAVAAKAAVAAGEERRIVDKGKNDYNESKRRKRATKRMYWMNVYRVDDRETLQRPTLCISSRLYDARHSPRWHVKLKVVGD